LAARESISILLTQELPISLDFLPFAGIYTFNVAAVDF
jgi:hypothetical protein